MTGYAESPAAPELGIRHHKGYLSPFTRHEAKGAWPNGTRVRKTHCDSTGDFTPVGGQGAVLGSLSDPELGYLYFVEWDHAPRLALACHENKLERVGP
jgi:hypothetical protein